MFTMFALTRMVVRGAVLAALVATIVSVVSAASVDDELEAIEEVAIEAYEWLVELVSRVTNSDASVGDIRLGDLASPQGWADLGAGLFGGEEPTIEVDTTVPPDVDVSGLVGAFDIARIVEEVSADGNPADG
ncbi:MAG: hypothetical protein AAGC53_12070 [Actinomycetota bacterium]